MQLIAARTVWRDYHSALSFVQHVAEGVLIELSRLDITYCNFILFYLNIFASDNNPFIELSTNQSRGDSTSDNTTP